MKKIIDDIKNLADKDRAAHCMRFFKTGVGEYAQGDLFLGVRVPRLREIAKRYFQSVSLAEIDTLIKNKYHEMRAVAIFMLVLRYKKFQEERDAICALYLKNVEYINNWDLVDLSAEYIVGPNVFPDVKILLELANSGHLWSERISVISTFHNIRQGDFRATLLLCEHFLTHKHDLMHKACGWMLKESGKRDLNVLLAFLDKFSKQMPRTMLRCSIEKLDEKTRKYYMQR